MNAALVAALMFVVVGTGCGYWLGYVHGFILGKDEGRRGMHEGARRDVERAG